ncbi:cytochrome ubiquinol oxidase subunit I, partial [Yoonia sp.]|uniref:cytochrome ubiquinol oxidase subunit I n=1 Tax=Yoonia sp. TaxID=2212373 RepID=UPI003974E0A5
MSQRLLCTSKERALLSHPHDICRTVAISVLSKEPLRNWGKMELETLLLSRIQFAANISFHILFPTITIALGWVLLFFK